MKFTAAAISLCLLCSTALAETKPPQTTQQWTLRQAIEYALQHTPDTAISRERIAQAEAMNMEAKAADFPQISLSGGYTATNNPMYSFGNILNQGEFTNTIDFNDPGRSDRLVLQTAVRYRIYNGGRDNAQKEIAQAEIGRAQSGHRQMELLLACEVVKNWQQIIQAEEMVEVQQETITTLEASLNVAKARYDAGDLLRQELLAIEAQLAQMQEQRIAAEHRRALARQRFLTLLGLPKQSFTLHKEEQEQQPPSLEIRRRQEMKALAEQERRAAAELDKAEGSSRPTVDAYAGYDMEYGPELEGSGHSWQAGVQLKYILFDGHSSEAKIAQAKARLREIAAQKRKLELALGLELEQARLDYEQAQKRLAVTDTAEKAAQEAARLSRLQFEEGTVLASTLIDYETRLADARARRISAKAEVVIALANLRRAAGYGQFAE